jgi:hypothetical protein
MMMGSETEFGILDGWTLKKAEAIQSAVVRSHVSLPSTTEGVFLASGGRAYVDQDVHNEYATPETHEPRALVLYEIAGRRLMARAASRAGLTLLCSNVDLSSGNSWGTHENYQCRAPFDSRQLAVLHLHLVTRVAYSGAGGLDPSHPALRPVLSPRACGMVVSYNRQGSYDKSLVFAKPRQYCRGARLHVFCGETLLSPRASDLKYGATALVVSLLDAGCRPALSPLASPVRALRTVNRDTSLSTRLPLADGRRLTALEIQRWLASWVESELARLPPWAPDALQAWHAALDDLECLSDRALRSLDWLIYAQLLRCRLSNVGITPTHVRSLNRALADAGTPDHLSTSERRQLEVARSVGEELYVELHRLEPDSLFESLERAGWLCTGLPGITDEAVECAMVTPPPGRAANRAGLIAGLLGRPGIRMTWSEVVNEATGQRTPIPEEHVPASVSSE